jgi:competence protein ComEA
MRLFVAAAFALYTASALLGQKTSSDSVDAATFRAICGACHSIALVEGLRTESEWRDEVDQMIKIGARGTEEQFQRVMRVLARTLTRVNVNTAEPRQIAPVLDVSDEAAAAVVKSRIKNGKFKTIEDLKKVPGVDPVKLEARRDRLMF